MYVCGCGWLARGWVDKQKRKHVVRQVRSRLVLCCAVQPFSAASESSFDSKTPRRICPRCPRLLPLESSPLSHHPLHARPPIRQPTKPIATIPTTTLDFQQSTFVDSEIHPLPPPRLQHPDTHKPPADRIRNRGNHTKWRCYKIPITVTVVVITTVAAPRANRAGAAILRHLPTPSTPAPWR